MRKRDLVDIVSSETCLSKSIVKSVLESTSEVISDALSRGEDVHFTGFGKFQVKHTSPRTVKNSETGKDSNIPSRAYAAFRQGSRLRRWINN